MILKVTLKMILNIFNKLKTFLFYNFIYYCLILFIILAYKPTEEKRYVLPDEGTECKIYIEGRKEPSFFYLHFHLDQMVINI